MMQDQITNARYRYIIAKQNISMLMVVCAHQSYMYVYNFTHGGMGTHTNEKLLVIPDGPIGMDFQG